MVRIISGTARGRTLVAPKGEGTRPTTDRVRESLMSALMSLRGGFEDALVLDAFAGSGALGLESLSRGARAAVLCDLSHEAQLAIEANIASCQMKERATFRKCNVLTTVPACRFGAYDLVFLDPPYAMDALDALSVVARADENGLLAHDAFIIYEYKLGGSDAVDVALGEYNLGLVRRKKYGDTMLDICRRK